MKIGFIGQGWIGKNYADDFVNRGYDVVRYGLEEEYAANKDTISSCEIVFIAVPTPTTKDGFDDSVVRGVLKYVGKGNIAVIKSTILPGVTESIQKENPDIYVFHSPEFLLEKTAAYNAANPDRNIIGIPIDSDDYKEKARMVLDVLPDAPYQEVLASSEAELVKYAGNCFLYTKVIFMNMLYDLVEATGGDWDKVREALIGDPRIGVSHTEPVHSSGHSSSSEDIQRGAGGHCFIKDFEAFREMYDGMVGEKYGSSVLRALAEKNINLMVNTNKDIELLEGVYGDLSKYK